MAELEREIFMRLLIDLFLERPGIERRLKEKQDAMQASSDAPTVSDRAMDFSKGLRVIPISPYAE